MSNTKVKICGLTCPKDVKYVICAGADFVGMVMYFPKSKRNISIETASKLIQSLREGSYGPSIVAVTVSPTVEQAEAIANAGFDYLQIHGEFDRSILDLDAVVDGELQIIRAYNRIDAEEIESFKEDDRVAYYLFDAAEPGSGAVFNWDEIPDKETLCKPFFLAGGLTPETVKDAVDKVNPYGVDVSSGVECDDQPTPEEVEMGESMKSEEKIRAFIKNATA